MFEKGTKCESCGASFFFVTFRSLRHFLRPKNMQSPLQIHEKQKPILLGHGFFPKMFDVSGCVATCVFSAWVSRSDIASSFLK